MNKMLSAFLALFLLVSCSGDDDNAIGIAGEYQNGIFVLNEGGAGTVSFIDANLSGIEHDIFDLVNPGNEGLGNYLQNIFFDNQRAYIISGSNSITIVDRFTFQFLGRISTGLSAPRYGTVMNGKAYVTNMNSYMSTADDFVAVIDLETQSVVQQIEMGRAAERIASYNGKVYVSNGAWGDGSGITVINTNSNTIEGRIETSLAPNSLAIVNGKLYALEGGMSGPGKLIRVSLENIQNVEEIDLPSTVDAPANLAVYQEKFYFTSAGKVYAFGLNATSFTDQPLIDTQSTNYYMGYGFNVSAQGLFLAEAAADFASDGKVYIYDFDGSLLKEFGAGLGPNGFYFN